MSIVDRALVTVGEALPRIGGALLLLVVGIPLAWLVARLVRRLLHSLTLDDLGERSGVHEGLSRLGLERSLSNVIARAVRIALVVLITVAAISLLGFGALGEALNAAVLFVPKLFIAIALVIGGIVAAEFLGERMERVGDDMALAVPLRQLTEAVVLALVVLTALALLGIPTLILVGLIALVIAAGVLALALAFGLGGREVAREISAGRSVAGVYRIGQRITVGEITGEITALDTSATVLRVDDGSTVRVPNHQLVESVVRLHAE
ncbi:MAG: mechanosensitive ion channel [Actinobacteria bacterium]|nr:mechanosensitive ion channel [Actinomycetota bacterium]